MRPYKKFVVSGAICTGKSSLARTLASRFGYKHISTGSHFRKYANLHNLAIDKGEEQNELISTKIDNDVIEQINNSNQIVVDGWLTGMLTRDMPDVYRILLTANISSRISRFAARENVSTLEAKRRIRLREKSVAQKVKKIYNRDDYFSKSNFDLIIDTTNMSQSEALELVCDTIK